MGSLRRRGRILQLLHGNLNLWSLLLWFIESVYLFLTLNKSANTFKCLKSLNFNSKSKTQPNPECNNQLINKLDLFRTPSLFFMIRCEKFIIRPSVRLSVYLPVCLSVYPSIHLSITLPLTHLLHTAV